MPPPGLVEDMSGQDGPVVLEELTAALEQEREICRVVGLEPGEDVQKGDLSAGSIRVVADHEDSFAVWMAGGGRRTGG
jgi:hypothetical protein